MGKEKKADQQPVDGKTEPYYIVTEDYEAEPVLTKFDEGSLLERRSAALMYIDERLDERWEKYGEEGGDMPEEYSIQGCLVFEGRSYPIFLYSFDEDCYLNLWTYARHLSVETQWLIKYFGSTSEDVAS